MKKTLLLSIIGLAICSSAFAQGKMNFILLKKVKEAENNTRSQSVDIFIKGDVSIIKGLVLAGGGTFKYAAGDIASVNLSLYQIGKIVSNKAIQRIESYPSHMVPLNDTMLTRCNVIPVHSGQTPLTQGYDGTGVVVGFIDSGIDFHHPDFKDNTGKSRVKFIWDHTLPNAANTPSAYGYGQEFTNTDIDNGLAEAHTDTVSAPSHGTHVAGVGVGNGLATGTYKGVAPGADIIMVALDFNYSLYSDAVEYIYSKAQAMGKPCVINASVGDYYGSHDGKDLQAQLISNLINAKPGRALVGAAGNAGDYAYHVGYTVTSDTNFTIFDVGGGAFYMQVWADTNDFKNVDFSIGADQMSPTHSFRGKIPFHDVSTIFQTPTYDSVYTNGKRIGKVTSYADTVAGNYLVEFLIEPDSTAYNWRFSTTGSGKFDFWDFGLVGVVVPPLSQMPDRPYYKSSDVNKTIVSGFQCLDNVITVANYINRRGYIGYYDTLVLNTTIIPGQRVISSSIGPTRDGRIKPDIAAPGDMNMAAVVVTMIPSIVSNYPEVLAKGGYHVRNGGTSHACPVVAGIAALYLQKNPTATAMDVKQAIINCTTKDQFTGSSLPNNYWGYGKVNAFTALTGCLTTGINNISGEPNMFSIYPNPSSDEAGLTISVSNLRSTDVAVLKIYNALGEVVKTISVNNSTTQLDNKLSPGIYFCNLLLNGSTVGTQKLVVF